MTEKFQCEGPVYRELSLADMQALVRQGRHEQSKAAHAYLGALFRALRNLFRTTSKRHEAGDHGVPAKA